MSESPDSWSGSRCLFATSWPLSYIGKSQTLTQCNYPLSNCQIWWLAWYLKTSPWLTNWLNHLPKLGTHETSTLWAWQILWFRALRRCVQQNCSTWFVRSGRGLLFLHLVSSNLFLSLHFHRPIGQHAYIGFLAWLEHFVQVWSHQDPSVSLRPVKQTNKPAPTKLIAWKEVDAPLWCDSYSDCKTLHQFF